MVTHSCHFNAAPVEYTIRHIAGVKNDADILTKALGLEPFAHFRDAMLNAKIILSTEAKSLLVTQFEY